MRKVIMVLIALLSMSLLFSKEQRLIIQTEVFTKSESRGGVYSDFIDNIIYSPPEGWHIVSFSTETAKSHYMNYYITYTVLLEKD